MNDPVDLFRDDYDLGKLTRVRPPGQDFELYITPRFSSHYAERRFESLSAALLRTVCRRKQVFVDVGAHYGFYTLMAGRENPDLEIWALEPIRENLEILRKNLDTNQLTTVRALEMAASDRDGMATIHKSAAADNSGFHSLPQVPTLAELEVRTTRLASLLADRQPSSLLVKIDTDGHEIAVLRGLAETLEADLDATLFVELNPIMLEQAGYGATDLLDQIESMGLRSYLIQEPQGRLVPLQPSDDWTTVLDRADYANLYCRPRDSAASLCFVSHSHGLAGAERTLAELVEQLIEYHGAVCNVVVPGQGELGRRLETLGAGVIAADYGWWCASEPLTESEVERRLADDLTRFLAYCLPEIEATGAEVICSNSIVSPYGAIAATVLELPHIWFLHEFGSEAAGYRFFLPFPEVLQFVESFSDFLFGATLSLPRTLFGQLDEACYDSLYPFIRPPQTVDEAVPPAATAETSPPLRLIDLASINPAKQQETDLRAVAILQERGHQVELVLQGPQDSEYVAMLRELGRSLEIADRLHIRPYSEEVWSSLSAADVVVISGPTHVFGRAAAEGMLSRLPVVYPLGTGIDEYMQDGLTGLGYEIGRPEHMAAQIERLIGDPELRTSIAEAAFRRARELFHRRGFSDKFLERARGLRSAGPAARPRLPDWVFEGLLVGIHHLGRESLELRKMLSSRLADLGTATDLLRIRTEEIESLKEVLTARETELESLESTLAARVTELEAVKPTFSACSEELAAIKPVLEGRNEELAAIKPVLAARDEELVAIKAVLAARDRELEAIKPVLEARDGELAAIKPVLAARQEETALLQKARDQQDRRIQDLDERLRELEALLHRLRRSRSGRLALWIDSKK